MADTNTGSYVWTKLQRFREVVLPASCISDSQVAAGAEIAADKLEHQYQPTFGQTGSAIATAERRVVHIVQGATGTVEAVDFTLTVAAVGNSTATMDLTKNGTSILAAPISFAAADTAFTLKPGSVSTPGLVDGDVLEVVVTVSAGTGTLPKGLGASVKIRELAD